MRHVRAAVVVLFAVLYPATTRAAPVTFAIIGDFGNASQPEADVAARLKSYNPEFVVTLGDNNYLGPTVELMDAAIGRGYHEFIKYPANSTSAYANQGASQINFYPVVGNHDWDEGIDLHSSYYSFPSENTRYYDFVRGPVHFYVVDNDPREPDGVDENSPQANWLRERLAASPEPWKMVLNHFPPYSPYGGGAGVRRWPFKEWGATHVLSGHDHHYERMDVDGLTYFINGLGGEFIRPIGYGGPYAKAVYSGDWGFMLVTADDEFVDTRFITRSGFTVDHTFEQREALAPDIPEPGATLGVIAAIGVLLGRAPRRFRCAEHSSCD